MRAHGTPIHAATICRRRRLNSQGVLPFHDRRSHGTLMLFAYSARIETIAVAWLMRLRVATQSLGMCCCFVRARNAESETMADL